MNKIYSQSADTVCHKKIAYIYKANDWVELTDEQNNLLSNIPEGMRRKPGTLEIEDIPVEETIE